MMGEHGLPHTSTDAEKMKVQKSRIIDETVSLGFSALARIMSLAPSALSHSSPRWIVQLTFCALNHIRKDLRAQALKILQMFNLKRAQATMVSPGKEHSSRTS